MVLGNFFFVCSYMTSYSTKVLQMTFNAPRSEHWCDIQHVPHMKKQKKFNSRQPWLQFEVKPVLRLTWMQHAGLTTPRIVSNFLDYSGTNIYLLLLLLWLKPFLDLISHFRPEPAAKVGHRVHHPASCSSFYLMIASYSPILGHWSVSIPLNESCFLYLIWFFPNGQSVMEEDDGWTRERDEPIDDGRKVWAFQPLLFSVH